MNHFKYFLDIVRRPSPVFSRGQHCVVLEHLEWEVVVADVDSEYIYAMIVKPEFDAKVSGGDIIKFNHKDLKIISTKESPDEKQDAQEASQEASSP